MDGDNTVACPGCGATGRWVAHYTAAVKQTVAELRRLEDGTFEAAYDEAATIVEEHPDEVFICLDCVFALTEEVAKGTPQ